MRIEMMEYTLFTLTELNNQSKKLFRFFLQILQTEVDVDNERK
jgi:hypothetical protein